MWEWRPRREWIEFGPGRGLPQEKERMAVGATSPPRIELSHFDLPQAMAFKPHARYPVSLFASHLNLDECAPDRMPVC